MAIADPSVAKVKEVADIVDVVRDVVALKKAGANLSGLCPFHGEKTPSFTVSPSKQFYHCFGCGAHGDAIKFVMETQRLDFVEAVELLADRYGISLEYTQGHGGVRKDYTRTLESLAGYYAESLRDEDKKYLRRRGIKAATIREWGIGYAPRSPKQIEKLKQMMLPMDQLSELGVVRSGDRGVYAHFTDRVMFPIRDHRGRVVGFSGRSLREDAKAKYVNSMQSAIFDKSRILFGWDRAADAIHKKNFVVIMEGQIDVILAQQAGISTAVATQGTALTEAHLPLIRRAGARVVLAYDGDAAGRTAAYKAAYLLTTNGIGGGVVLWPEGEDPASMIADGRADEVKTMLKYRAEMIGWVIAEIVRAHNLDDPRGQSDAVTACREYLDALGDRVISDRFVPVAAAACRVRPERMTGQDVEPVAEARPTIQRAGTEVLVLWTMREHPESIDMVVDMVDDAAWSHTAAYRALCEERMDDPTVEVLGLYEGLRVLTSDELDVALKHLQRRYLLGLRDRLVAEKADVKMLIEVNEKIRKLR